jgi:hypothetical protein
MEASMSESACVNCGEVRAKHHRDGWCFWLSDTDSLPIQSSTTEVAVLQVVDDEGRPLVRSKEHRDG